MPAFSARGFGGGGGGNPYGTNIGPIALPPNIYSQVNQAIPGIAPAGGASASVINSELSGNVNPDVQRMLQEKSATLGVNSGMPSTGGPGSFGNNTLLESLGLNSEQQQQQGQSNYLNFLTGTGSTMTNPNLAYEVSLQNATDAAAPNPAAAAGLQTYLFNQGMNSGGA